VKEARSAGRAMTSARSNAWCADWPGWFSIRTAAIVYADRASGTGLA
jgi:hypothetical protein